jgi:hypothetical protein
MFRPNPARERSGGLDADGDQLYASKEFGPNEMMPFKNGNEGAKPTP